MCTKEKNDIERSLQKKQETCHLASYDENCISGRKEEEITEEIPFGGA